MEAKKEDIKIYGKLVNVTTENVVADAQQIWDSNFEENQQNINSQQIFEKRKSFRNFALCFRGIFPEHKQIPEQNRRNN